MIIAVTGIRDLDEASVLDVELATLDAANAATVMRFGGADGSDTVALESAHGRTRCEVIVPDRVANQPLQAREAIQNYADAVVELKHPLFPRPEAYYARNRRLVNGVDRLLAFTDGQMRGGTYWTIRYAATRNVPIDLVQVIRGQNNTHVKERVKSGSTGQPFSRPTFAGARYRQDWRRDVILSLKNRNHAVSTKNIASLADELGRLISEEPELRDADAIVSMPRRIPGMPSDLVPLAASIANRTHKEYLRDWLVRIDEPSGGQFISERMRFSPIEHARTLRVVGDQRPHKAIVLDNVLTMGGTMEGAFQAIGRDAANVTIVGLAALYSPDVETES